MLIANWLKVCFGAQADPLFNSVFQKSLTVSLRDSGESGHSYYGCGSTPT